MKCRPGTGGVVDNEGIAVTYTTLQSITYIIVVTEKHMHNWKYRCREAVIFTQLIQQLSLYQWHTSEKLAR